MAAQQQPSVPGPWFKTSLVTHPLLSGTCAGPCTQWLIGPADIEGVVAMWQVLALALQTREFSPQVWGWGAEK